MASRSCRIALLLLQVVASEAATVRSGNMWNNTLPILFKSGFAFGFYALDYSSLVLAVYNNDFGDLAGYDVSTVVWSPPNSQKRISPNSTLEFQDDGNLILLEANGSLVWQSNTGGIGVVMMNLTNSGNLVLLTQNGTIVWQSFDSPTDTWLPGQILKVGTRLGSRVSVDSQEQGSFYLQVELGGVFLYARTGSNDLQYAAWCDIHKDQGITHLELGQQVMTCYSRRYDAESLSGRYLGVGAANVSLIRLRPDGDLVVLSADGAEYSLLTQPNDKGFAAINSGTVSCGKSPGSCGVMGMCVHKADPSTAECTCLPPLRLRNSTDTYQGCLVEDPPVCNGANKLIAFPGYYYSPAIFMSTLDVLVISIEACKVGCLNNCSCKAMVYGEGCFHLEEIYTFWDGGQTPIYDFKSTVFIKVAESPDYTTSSSVLHKFPVLNESSTVSLVMRHVLLTLLGFGILLLLGILWFIWKTNIKKNVKAVLPSFLLSSGPQQYSYRELCVMTGNFGTKLGSGAFGTVFLGRLPDGTRVAVKRLSSAQHGLNQFEAEVKTIGSIHHRNLVKLLGYGAAHPHYYLVLEFVPNLSLDKWLFTNQPVLTWKQRYNIILGITRGLHYLHEECQERVLHLDIKPQNILLDSNFQAKICDFGLARLLAEGDTSINTTIRGTPGYIAPEWLQGRVTEKADIYSYGIVLLEILIGRKTVPLATDASSIGMARVKAFKRHEMLEELAVKTMSNLKEVELIAGVGIWCTQQKPWERPSMREVLVKLDAGQGNKIVQL